MDRGRDHGRDSGLTTSRNSRARSRRPHEAASVGRVRDQGRADADGRGSAAQIVGGGRGVHSSDGHEGQVGEGAAQVPQISGPSGATGREELESVGTEAQRLEDVGRCHHTREDGESELPTGGDAVADRRGDQERGSGPVGGPRVVGGEDGARAEGGVRAEYGAGPGDDVEGVAPAEGHLDERDALLHESEDGLECGVRVAAADDGEQPVRAQRGEQIHRTFLSVLGSVLGFRSGGSR